MSKTVKGLIENDYTAKLGDTSDAMVISIRGMKGIAATKLRRKLATKKISIVVMRNALARKKFKGTGLEGLASFLTGPSALAFGGASVVEVAREIVGLLKDFPGLELKGAILDGTLFEGDKGVKELSKYPTKIEAIGNIVTLMLSPGKNLVAQLKGPGSNIAGLIAAIEAKFEKDEAIAEIEAKSEKGEAIAEVG